MFTGVGLSNGSDFCLWNGPGAICCVGLVGEGIGWKSFSPRDDNEFDPVNSAVLAGNVGLEGNAGCSTEAKLFKFGWNGKAAGCSGLGKKFVGVG